MATQLVQLPKPWEIAMDWGGHFFRHAATLLLVKEVSHKDFRKLDCSYGCRKFLPDITANVCSFRLDERGWCDYACQINHPWEDEFKGFYEGKKEDFGSDLMWRNLNHWMEAYMRDGEEQQIDGFVNPEYFFDDLRDLGVVFTQPSIKGKIQNEYTLKCYADKHKLTDGSERCELYTYPTKGNATKLFFKAEVYDWDSLYEAVEAQYKVYRKYIPFLKVKFIPQTFVDDFFTDGKPIERDVDIDPDILEHLNSITNKE